MAQMGWVGVGGRRNVPLSIDRTRDTSQFSRWPLNEDARANTAKKEMREHQRNNSRQMGGWFAPRNRPQ
jgi:hypothetical protein